MQPIERDKEIQKHNQELYSAELHNKTNKKAIAVNFYMKRRTQNDTIPAHTKHSLFGSKNLCSDRNGW
jgi:hypothetical protein